MLKTNSIIHKLHEAAERARREAAEQARREAAQRQAAERARHQAQTQNHANLPKANADNLAFGRKNDASDANSKPQGILDTISEKTGIDANFTKYHFQRKFAKGNLSANNLPPADKKAAQPKSPDKNEAQRDDWVEQAKNGFLSFSAKARDAFQNVTKNIDPNSTAGKMLKAFKEIPAEKKIAFAASLLTGAGRKPQPPAERILNASRNGDSTAATRTLRQELESFKGADAVKKRTELINDPKIKEALGNVGRDLMTKDYDSIYKLSDEDLKQRAVENYKSFSELSRAAELAGQDGARIISESFIRDVAASEPYSTDYDQFTGIGSLTSSGLKQAIEGGNGTSFAVNLTSAFKRVGNQFVAENIAVDVRESLQTVREDFDDKAKKAEELNGELARLLAGFSPALSDSQKQKAIDAFKQRHTEEYGEFEEAGRKLASTLNGANDIINLPPDGGEDVKTISALQDEAREVLKNLPRVGQTEPGQKAIADAIEKQGAGKSTFMDLLPDIAKQTNDARKYSADIANLTTKAIGTRVLQLANNGRERDAARLFRGLERNNQLFGIDRNSMNGIAGDMRQLMVSKTGSPEKIAAQERLEQRFRKVGGGTPGLDPTGRGSQALRGLGLVVSIAGNADSWKNFDDKKLTDKISTIGSTFQIGVDGGTLALDVLGKGKGAAVKSLLKTAGPIGGFTAVLDGINAIDNFKTGDYAEGVLSSASAAGGAILAVAAAYSAAGAAQVVPVWGQIAGGVLVVGATVGNIALGKHYEHQDEADAKAFLQGAGLSEPAADALSDLTSDRENVGPFITQVAPYLGVEPGELLQHLATLDKNALDDIVKMSHDLKSNDKQEYEATADNDDKVGELKGIGIRSPFSSPVEMPESLYGAARWMTKLGYSPYEVELPPPNQGNFEVFSNVG